jgi:23S rRNA (uracil1939-C5)-methyltransferase
MRSDRVTAEVCPHHPACPGCPLVAQPYPRQLADKRARVEAALVAALAPHERPAIPPVVAAPAPEGYRVQTKLVAHAARRGVVLGLYRPESHHVVDVAGCPLHAPGIRRAIPVVRDVLAEEKIAIHGAGRRGVRYVLLRVSTQTRGVLVTLVASALSRARAMAIARALRARMPLAGLALNENTTVGNEILGPNTVSILGAPVLAERYGGLVLSAGPAAFVQANAVMAGRIYRAIAAEAALAGHERVVDLYAGIGGIALTLAERAASVLGVEEVGAAVAAARTNARRNRRRNVRFESGLVEEYVRSLAPGSIDLVTLNPPRRGCGERTAHALAALRAPRLLYLSCHASSFARDARALVAGGYRLVRVQPFDLLPQTDHVEVLGTFERAL